MKLETSAPDEFQGIVIGQINQRRGIIHNTKSDAGYVVVEAEVPLKDLCKSSFRQLEIYFCCGIERVRVILVKFKIFNNTYVTFQIFYPR